MHVCMYVCMHVCTQPSSISDPEIIAIHYVATVVLVVMRAPPADLGYNETTQAVCYTAVFEALYSKPWFDGLLFWYAVVSLIVFTERNSTTGFTDSARCCCSCVLVLR